MHPGILVLPALALTLSGAMHWLATRRSTGRPSDAGEARATLLYGLIATAFLWPALSIPDGVPSPSATLYAFAPWQGLDRAPDPSSGNTALTDVTFQIQPWLLLLRSQMRAGELPLWNPYSFLGQPFWANGQSAPLFPLHLLFAAMPTMWGFLLLPWLRILIGALGTRRLALALGISPGGALLAGVVFPLSGMVTGYLLFPMANALVLVPWVLWATETLAAGTDAERTSWRPLAVCVALLALGGHPGTLSHCALLSAIYLLVRGIPWRRLGLWTLGWTTGGALAMVHLLPVALYLPLTARWGDPEAPPPGPGPPWAQVLPLAFRLLQPWVYGRAEHGTWHGAFYEPGSRVFAGLVTLLLVLVALQALARREALSRRETRDRRLLAVVVLLVFSGLVAYRTPILLGAVESLPVVGRALHHRLFFAVELCLALLAGFGIDRLAAGPARRLVRAAAFLAGGFVVLAAFLALAKNRPPGDVVLEQLPWILWLLVGALALWWFRRGARLAETATLLALLSTVAVAAELTVAHAPSSPGLSVAQLYPSTAATRYLEGRPGAMAAVGSVLRPGTSMVYALRDLRGDDPARPRRFDHIYENLGSTRTPFFHPVESWDHPWLDEAGVRWVMAPPGSGPKDPSWRLAYDGDDASVFERLSARPEAWLADTGSDESAPGSDSSAQLGVQLTGQLIVQRPTNSTVRVEGLERSRGTGATGRLVVGQAWAPGWTARAGGRMLETVAHDDFLLAVDLSGKTGSPDAVEFVYRPPGLVTGAWISLVALLWLVLPPAIGGLRTRRSNLPEGTIRSQYTANRSGPTRSAV